MSLPWKSNSADKSGSGNFNVPSPSVDGSRPDPSGKTTNISDNVRSTSQGVFSPASASPENSKAPFQVPSATKDASPFSGGNSNNRSGSNSNISK